MPLKSEVSTKSFKDTFYSDNASAKADLQPPECFHFTLGVDNHKELCATDPCSKQDGMSLPDEGGTNLPLRGIVQSTPSPNHTSTQAERAGPVRGTKLFTTPSPSVTPAATCGIGHPYFGFPPRFSDAAETMSTFGSVAPCMFEAPVATTHAQSEGWLNALTMPSTMLSLLAPHQQLLHNTKPEADPNMISLAFSDINSYATPRNELGLNVEVSKKLEVRPSQSAPGNLQNLQFEKSLSVKNDGTKWSSPDYILPVDCSSFFDGSLLFGMQDRQSQSEFGQAPSSLDASLEKANCSGVIQSNSQGQRTRWSGFNDVRPTCSPSRVETGELRGHVIQLSRTQAGSKYLQRQLQKCNPNVVNLILLEVEHHVAQLMCDAFGNYLCSAMFQACSVQQRKWMLQKLAQSIVVIACDKRGTHALQALIVLLNTVEEQDLLMQAINGHVTQLCMDPNGTHVVQRLLLCFPPPFTDGIFIAVLANLVSIAHHPYGLCVLKKCITQVTSMPRQKDAFLNQLAYHALDLVQSPYGNYAVQHAFDEWGGLCCTPIFKSLQGSMAQLSAQKCSSNVVEKIFFCAPQQFKWYFINELIETEQIDMLLNSNYGHFVVKRALQLAELSQVSALLRTFRGKIAQLFSRRLRGKWEKVMQIGIVRLGKVSVEHLQT